MAEQFIEGIDKIIRKLDKMDFQSSNQKNIIRRVMRKGGNIIKDEVKRLIPSRNDFPYIFHIKRSVKVVTSKSRARPGVNVYTKGADVPVAPGAGRDWWTLGAYQILVFFGNYKNKNRTGRLNRGSGQSRGDVQGITGYNPYKQAFNNKGRRALIVIAKNMKPEIEKEWRKRI